MLKITNDGRKLALDQRLVSDAFPDSVDGKVSECARQCYDIWENTKDTKSAQLVFCDLSTPKNDGTFNVYDDLKQKLMDKDCLIFMEGQYPIRDRKNFPFNTPIWKESKKLAGKNGYKHPVRVVYNPRTMTYRTIRNKQDFQVIDKKDVAFYKEVEKTDKSIKVCEINEEDFLYLNFDVDPKPTEEELIQLFEKSKKDTGLQERAMEMEEQLMQENRSNVPNFGTEEETTEVDEEEQKEEKWDLSGTINQCIQRYAAQLTEEQINEILLGLENGLTEEEVKSYFTFPVEKMNQYRRAYQFTQ